MGLSECAAATGVVEGKCHGSVPSCIERVGSGNRGHCGVETVGRTVSLATHNVSVSIQSDAAHHAERCISLEYEGILSLQ